MGARLRAALAYRSMSQRRLAELSGVPQATIATYVSGRVAMPAPAIVSTSQALQVDPGWLLLGPDLSLNPSPLSYAA